MIKTSSRIVLAAGLAFICTALLGPAALAGEGNSLTEPASGKSFPLVRESLSSQTSLELTGVGIRKKMIFKVYAFGFYLDTATAKPALTKWSGKTADQLRADASFYEALIAAPAEKQVVMTFLRKVKGEAMREALADSMEHVPASDPGLGAFLALWDEVISNGAEIVLTFGTAGEVGVYRDGKLKGEVTSPAVATALQQSWLGTNTVSENIRDGAAERFPDLI